MPCSSLKRTPRGRASIVQRLCYRSVTGHDLGLHVHRYTARTISLFYKSTRDTGCYTSYIERRFLHSRDDSIFMRGLLNNGLDEGCVSTDGSGPRKSRIADPASFGTVYFRMPLLDTLSASQNGIFDIQMQISSH